MTDIPPTMQPIVERAGYEVKNRLFPRGHCAWTTIGVSALAHPGLLVEIKCVAVLR